MISGYDSIRKKIYSSDPNILEPKAVRVSFFFIDRVRYFSYVLT
jgi:hypothetical protein